MLLLRRARFSVGSARKLADELTPTDYTSFHSWFLHINHSSVIFVTFNSLNLGLPSFGIASVRPSRGEPNQTASAAAVHRNLCSGGLPFCVSPPNATNEGLHK